MPKFNAPDGTRLHYEIDDFTDPWRRSPVLILQHGMLKSSRFGYAWVPYLSRYFRLVRPDLRGHGQSASGHCLIDAQTLLSDLDALIDHLGVEQVHYCGESLGGILGMLAGARLSHRFCSLSFVSTPLALTKETLQTFAMEFASWGAAMRALGIHEWSRRMNGYRFGNSLDSGLQEWQATEMGRQDLDTMVRYAEFASCVNVSKEVAKIQAPALGLYAVENAISGAAARALMEALPSARIVKLPSLHHTAFTSLPATCASHVLAFCSTIEGSTFHEL